MYLNYQQAQQKVVPKNYNQAFLSKIGSISIDYPRPGNDRIQQTNNRNQQIAFQNDINNLHRFQQMSIGRRTGLEGSELFFPSLNESQYQLQNYQNIPIQQNGRRLYQESQRNSGGNDQRYQATDGTSRNSKLVNKIQHQNEILQQLCENVTETRDQLIGHQIQNFPNDNDYQRSRYKSTMDYSKRQNQSYHNPQMMPSHMNMNMSHKEMQTEQDAHQDNVNFNQVQDQYDQESKQNQLQSQLKQVRIENIMLKIQLHTVPRARSMIEGYNMSGGVYGTQNQLPQISKSPEKLKSEILPPIQNPLYRQEVEVENSQVNITEFNDKKVTEKILSPQLSQKSLGKKLIKPKIYNIKKEQQTFIDMKRNRGRANLQHWFKIFSIMLSFINRVKGAQKNIKAQFISDFPRIEEGVINELTEWCDKISIDIQKELLTNKSLQCSVIQGESVAVSFDDSKKNVITLQTMVKEILNVLVKNLDTLPQFSQFVMGLQTHNFLATPPEYFFKFEINRLNFTDQGGVCDMNPQKGKMIILLLILVRVYLIFISKLVTKPLAMALQDQVKEKANIRSYHYYKKQRNIHHIISVIYEILMEYLRELVVVQKNNQKHLAPENKIMERPDRLLKLQCFPQSDVNKQSLYQMRNQQLDEPILYPLLDKNLLKIVYQGIIFFNIKDKNFTQSVKAQIDSFGQQVYDICNSKYKEERLTMKNASKQEMVTVIREHSGQQNELFSKRKESRKLTRNQISQQEVDIKNYIAQSLKQEKNNNQDDDDGQASVARSQTIIPQSEDMNNTQIQPTNKDANNKNSPVKKDNNQNTNLNKEQSSIKDKANQKTPDVSSSKAPPTQTKVQPVKQ